jgi:hypothetical protein
VLPSLQPTVSVSSKVPSQPPTRTPSVSSASKPTVLPSLVPSKPPAPTPLPSFHPSLRVGDSFCPSVIPTVVPTVAPTSYFSVLTSSTTKQQIFRGSLFLLGRSYPASSTTTTTKDIHLENGLANQQSFILFGGKSLANDVIIGSRESRSFYSEVSQPSLFLDSDSRSSTILRDIKSDGFDDLLLGFPEQSKCLIYLGSSTRKEFTHLPVSFAIYGAAAGDDAFGWASAGVGDYDQDGMNDFLVSAKNVGIVYLIYGKESRASDLYVEEMTDSEGFGIIGQESTFNAGLAVSSAGDFNQDRANDILISAFSFTGEGIVYLLFGNPHSSEDIDLNLFSATMGFIFKTPVSSFSGLSLAGLGDFNQDGFDDIAIGSLPYQGGYSTQATYVVFGRNRSFSEINNIHLSLTELKTGEEGFKITG